MADFGNAGKLTIRTDKGAVMVKAGQKIEYFLNVQGDIPVFSFACSHKVRLSEKNFPGPQAKSIHTVLRRMVEAGEIEKTEVSKFRLPG